MTTNQLLMPTGENAAADPAARRMAYDALIARLRQRLPGLVSAGSRVLVASRGDEELLRFRGIQAGHFPQTTDGRYAGHYPADSAAAIAHLEALSAQGNDYLLFPQPALWWLEHYDVFARHLAEHHRELHRDEDLVLFQLAGAREEESPVRDSLDAVLDARWAQLAGILDAVLPAGAPIVVISELPPLHVSGRSVLHVAASATGIQASDVGGQPLSFALRDAIRSGARYVIVPRFGDPATIDGILSTVRSRYRLLLDQASVCAAFETIPVGRATSHQLRASSPASSSPQKRGERRVQA